MEMDLRTAFQKSIETLVDFVSSQVDTNKTQVLFRTYAPVHFRFTPLPFSLYFQFFIVCLIVLSYSIFLLSSLTLAILSVVSIKIYMNIGILFYPYQPSSLYSGNL